MQLIRNLSIYQQYMKSLWGIMFLLVPWAFHFVVAQSPISIPEHSEKWLQLILGWSIFCFGVLIGIFSLCHYYKRRNLKVTLIGIAFFCSSLIYAYEVFERFFTINPLISDFHLSLVHWHFFQNLPAFLLFSTGTFLLFCRPQRRIRWENKNSFLVIISSIFLFVSLLVIFLEAVASSKKFLPLTKIHEIPSLIFYIASSIVFGIINVKRGNVFIFYVFISMILFAGMQGCLIFYNEDVNISYLLQIFSFILPFVGIVRLYVKSEQQYRELLFSLSHRLRTPLNSITGFSDQLIEGIDGALPQNEEENLSQIQKKGEDLLYVIKQKLEKKRDE